jgi:hypothetical protein
VNRLPNRVWALQPAVANCSAGVLARRSFSGRRLTGDVLGGIAIDDLYLALHVGAFFNQDSRRPKVSDQAGSFANCDLARRLKIAVRDAHQLDFARRYIRSQFALPADGQAAIGHLKRALYFAIDVQAFLTRDISSDDNPFSDNSDVRDGASAFHTVLYPTA